MTGAASDPSATGPGSTAARRAPISWRARSSWVLLVALLPALHVLGSCVRDSDDSAAADPPVEPAPTTDATSPTTAGTEAPTTTSAVDATTVPSAPAFVPPEGNPDDLDEWQQLAVQDGRLVTLDGVTPYALNSALFSDHAHKLRTVWVPEGAAAGIGDPGDTLDFPVGTVITKTFYYPLAEGSADDASLVARADEAPTALADGLDLATVRLLETRILVHRADGWDALPYVWNAEQNAAELRRVGDLAALTLVDADAGIEQPFTYLVPDVNQCANCHAVDHTSGEIRPIGPATRHLATDVDLGAGPEPQLAAWIERGILTDAPTAVEAPPAADWTDETASLDDRARAYLDINCAHCHNPSGAADTSGLFLEHDTEFGLSLGICKKPIAAGTGTGGRQFDIVPGAPDESIFTYRMESTDPAEMMPELGRSLAHDEGVDLITEWIASLPGSC